MLLVMCMVLNELRVVHESIRPLVEDVTDLPLLFTTAMRIRFLISEYFSRRWEAMGLGLGLGLAHAQKECEALQVCSRSAVILQLATSAAKATPFLIIQRSP